jgi:hypothetical protein
MRDQFHLIKVEKTTYFEFALQGTPKFYRVTWIDRTNPNRIFPEYLIHVEQSRIVIRGADRYVTQYKIIGSYGVNGKVIPSEEQSLNYINEALNTEK